MTNKLRELVEMYLCDGSLQTFEDRERFRKRARKILDAEDDSGPVDEIVRTAPARIYLQVSDNESDHGEPFPSGYGDEITWCADSVLSCEVEYIRSDLTTHSQQVRSGGVSDEQVEQIIARVTRENSADGMDGDSLDRLLVRAALEGRVLHSWNGP